MKKEFGKWLMDIAKYVTTAIILTSIFGGIKEQWIVYVCGVITTSITLGWGLFLTKESSNQEKIGG